MDMLGKATRGHGRNKKDKDVYGNPGYRVVAAIGDRDEGIEHAEYYGRLEMCACGYDDRREHYD